MASFLGARGYDRQAYASEPGQEAAFVLSEMRLAPGDTVADVGCGSGRHLPYWREAGMRPIGLDVAAGFRPEVVADAANLPLRDGAVAAVVALGGIGGYVALDPLLVELSRVARTVVVLATFSLPFARRHMGIEGTRVDEIVHARDAEGQWGEFTHGHECHMPGDLPGEVYSIEPGRFARRDPSDEFPELLSVWRIGS